MTHQLIGNPAHFALGFELLPDPDPQDVLLHEEQLPVRADSLSAANWRRDGDPETWEADDLQTAMVELGVGIQTLTWNLKNLGWISESERQAWLDRRG